MEYYTATSRCLRAAALKNNLDPDRTLPEDILLLESDKDGNLKVRQELEDAENGLKYEMRLGEMQCKTR